MAKNNGLSTQPIAITSTGKRSKRPNGVNIVPFHVHIAKEAADNFKILQKQLSKDLMHSATQAEVIEYLINRVLVVGLK